MALANNRIKNSRQVTFSADYKVGKKTYYEKGKKYYISKNLVDSLKKRGAKFKAESIDFESELAKAKKARKKDEKEDIAIIDYTYFISEIAVAKRSKDSVLEDLEFKIKKYEKDFLIKMFGFDMYEDFINGIEQSPIEEKWDQLLTGRHEWMGFE